MSQVDAGPREVAGGPLVSRVAELDGMPDEDRRKIMGGNVMELLNVAEPAAV